MIAHSQLAPLPNQLPFRVVSKTIGQGAYACIKKAVPHNAQKPVFAVKFIHKEYAIRNGRLSKKQLDLETSLHGFLGEHPNVVRFFGTQDDVVWRWIAMELAEGGDLFDKIESDVGVGEDIAHLYFTQLISAVSHMHSKKVAHRDLKPENILLAADGNLKIADFGLATMFEYKGQQKLCYTSCGSPPYTAPEVVASDRRQKGQLESGYQAHLVDIWSCAVVLFVLLVGNTPWEEPLDRSFEYHEYVKTNGHPDDELWHRLPQASASLLRGMLCVDPAQRLSLQSVQQHAWFMRENSYLNADGRIQNPVGMATEMFESMKIDFTQTIIPSQSLGQDQDSMDIDSNDTSTSHHIVFDRESRNDSIGDGPISQSYSMEQASWDERLVDEPSCSQFSSTPRVPLTRTQFARQFKDIMPSHALTRFFSFWSADQLRQKLFEAMTILNMTTSDTIQPEQSHLSSPIQIKTRDSRRCLMNGNISIERLQGVEGIVHEISFNRTLGDPVEWRRLFKNMVLLCKDAVFRPDDSMPLLSQASMQ